MQKGTFGISKINESMWMQFDESGCEIFIKSCFLPPANIYLGTEACSSLRDFLNRVIDSDDTKSKYQTLLEYVRSLTKIHNTPSMKDVDNAIIAREILKKLGEIY